MESTNNNNLHHHHLQQHQASSLSPSSSYAHVGGGTTHSWTPNITLNAGNNFNQNHQEADPRSRGLTHKNNSMIQDLGYHNHWMSKEEISGFFPKFTEMLNSSPSSSMEGYDIQPPSSTTQMKSEHSAQISYPNNFSGTSTSAGGNYFSQIYPSINISPTYSTAVSSSFDMRTQSLDLLTSPGSFLSQQYSQDDHDHLGAFTDNPSFSLHHMQHPNHRSSCSNSTNIPSHFNNGAAESKRGGSYLMADESSSKQVSDQSQTVSKKSRLEPRPPCPPFKVRKEKLGDRIAALQQLVAPFGKTDTASVLMEAIGYIKFLQGQVETLSVPYMKPSQNQTNRAMHGGGATSEANAETKQDLRSRGLCLVPLSCMSYIAGDHGSIEMWQQPNFGRAT